MEFLINLLNLKNMLLIALVFIPLQIIYPMHADQRILRNAWRNDLVYLFFNSLPIKFGLLFIITLAVFVSDLVIPPSFKQAIARQPYLLQIIELIMLSDLCFYGVHRLFHVVPALWRFHAIHHSIKDMDWLAAHRVHPVDQILTKGASLIPCFALGFSEWAITTSVLLYQWHSLLLHANLRLRFGPLRWILASPEFHHWHHSNQPEAWGKNFSGQLSFWDLLFGTGYMPKGKLPTCYGTDDPVPTTYLAQILYPFQRSNKGMSLLGLSKDI